MSNGSAKHTGRRARRGWHDGDLFLVPLSDGYFTVAQVLSHEFLAMDSAICAFSLRRMEQFGAAAPIARDEVISVQYVTVELLDSGEWPVAGHAAPVIPAGELELDGKRARHFAGTQICGSGVISSFLNACFGLEMWDDWVDPEMLDKLLLTPQHKPALVVYKDERAIN